MSRLRDVEKPNRYKDFLRLVARVQIKHPFVTLGVLLALTVVLIGGVTQVKTVASLEKMMPSDIPEVEAFNALRDQGLGQDMLAIVISQTGQESVVAHSDITGYEYYRKIKELKEVALQEHDILAAWGMSDVIDAAARAQHVAITEDTYGSILADPRVQQQLAQFVNRDRTTTIIMLSTDVSADDARMNLLASQLKAHIPSVGAPYGATVQITGTPIIQQRLGQVIEHDRGITEKLSALFVFILVAIVFGSIIAAFVPMASILLSIVWLYGAMGYLKLPISTLAGGVAAMVIGIGVDYSIHLRNKFEYERKKGESLAFAVEETMANTGYVLTIVTAVTAIAFLTFLLGQMPEMGRFGLLMALGVSLAFILSVIGLPALFIVEEKIIYAARLRMRFGVEHELELAQSKQAKRVERDLRQLRGGNGR